MTYIEGTPREQLVLFSQTLDSLIAEDNPVRFIDAYVDSLDVVALGFRTKSVEVGRPAYHPKMLLKIYIYGYLNRIRSSRRIMRECTRNIELIWLAQQQAPDFRTIADFRKDNRIALKDLFSTFLKFCRRLGLLSMETIGIDGTKMRAQNNANNVYYRERMGEMEKRIEAAIEEYLKELEDNDTDPGHGGLKLDGKKIKERVAALHRARGKVQAVKNEFAKDPEKKVIYGNDADCRMMTDGGKIRPGYNVQTAVDAHNKLIVVAEVTNEANERNQMTPMLKAVSETKKGLDLQKRTVVEMDCGYHSEDEIMAHKDSQEFDIAVPSPKDCEKTRDKKKMAREAYRADHFVYDAVTDKFICPEGNSLPRVTSPKGVMMNGKRVWIYRGGSCDRCPQGVLCTRNPQGRTITVREHHEVIESFRVKMRTEPYKKRIRQRKEICEHPFGTLKRTFGYDHFMQKGLPKVRAEFSFMCLIYNMKRMLNILSPPQVMAALRTG